MRHCGDFFMHEPLVIRNARTDMWEEIWDEEMGRWEGYTNNLQVILQMKYII